MAMLPTMLTDYARLMRPHHWVKNGFVAVPLFLSPHLLGLDAITTVLMGVLAFCLVSSAVYVLNDIADCETDRLHPVKCNRPLAAGRVKLPACWILFAALVGIAALIATVLPFRFGIVLGAYLGLNLAYSFRLKRVAILDIMSIALGFVLRVLAGIELIGSNPTVWIILITWLVALFLALAKRRDDIVRQMDAQHRQSLAGYNKPFLDAALSVVLGATLVSYMICMTDVGVMTRLGSRHLYLTVLFVTGGALRYLQITFVEERSGSPTDILLRDRFLQSMVGGWLLTMAALLYFHLG